MKNSAAIGAVGVALLGYRTWSVDQQYQQLTQAVVTHIEHEHPALNQTTADAPDVLARMFVDYGASDAQAVSQVRFTKLCPVMGRQAIHAVLIGNDMGSQNGLMPGMDHWPPWLCPHNAR